jgi:hypothetical protein
LPVATNERAFWFAGRRYAYARDRNHPTWRSERVVEIAIAEAAVNGRDPSSTLEVGNVLAWYGLGNGHTVVDKYERFEGVTNVDILDYDGGPFSFIVSISTIEHVGRDERPRDSTKAARAIDHMQADLLAPGGEMLVTVPVGYHPDLDDEIASGRWGVARYLGRGPRRRWTEVDADVALSTLYGWPNAGASAIAVLNWGPGDPCNGKR